MNTSFTLAKLSIVCVVREAEESVIYQVLFNDTKYALKVYHMKHRPEELEEPRLSRWWCESRAYQRLHTEGICDAGHVPKIYAQFPSFDPSIHAEISTKFGSDRHWPCALLLEWLDIISPMTRHNYTPERWQKAVTSFRRINSVNILHRDIYPRNCVITNESPERVMWIDYDVSETLETLDLSERAQRGLKMEVDMVIGLGDILAECQANNTPFMFG